MADVDENEEKRLDPSLTDATIRQNSGSSGRLSSILKRIFCSPEIPTALYFIANGLFTPAQQHFIYWRICLYKYDSESMCQQIDTSPSLATEEAAVQVDYAKFAMIYQIASYAPVMITALLYGSWCDRFSYRIPMLLPHIGCTLVTSIYLIFSFLPNQAINPVYLGFASVILGLAGQNSTVGLAAYSYVSRQSNAQKRLMRLGIVEASLALGDMLGYCISAFGFGGGTLYDRAFMLQMAINLYAVVYIATIVPELHVFSIVKARVIEQAHGSWFRYLCSPKENLATAFKIVFGRHAHRSGEKRLWLITMVMVYLFCAISVSPKAITQTLYSFVTLQPISLTPFQYAIFQTAFTGSCSMGLFAILPLLRLHCRPFLPFSDAAVGVTGIVSRIAALVTLGLGGLFPSVAPWVYCCITMCSSLVHISLRSGMTKLVEKNEQGRMFAVNSVFENLAGLLGGLAFSALYSTLVTVQLQSAVVTAIIHGFTILTAAGLAIVPLILLIWLGNQPIQTWAFRQ